MPTPLFHPAVNHSRTRIRWKLLNGKQQRRLNDWLIPSFHGILSSWRLFKTRLLAQRLLSTMPTTSSLNDRQQLDRHHQNEWFVFERRDQPSFWGELASCNSEFWRDCNQNSRLEVVEPNPILRFKRWARTSHELLKIGHWAYCEFMPKKM